MGEVRVKVTLSNALDDELSRLGKLPTDQVRRYEADALINIGAVRSVIPVHVLEKLAARALTSSH